MYCQPPYFDGQKQTSDSVKQNTDLRSAEYFFQSLDFPANMYPDFSATHIMDTLFK